MTLTRLRSLPAAILLSLTAASLGLVAAPAPADAAPDKFAGMHKARTDDEKAAVRTVRVYNAAAVAGNGNAICKLYTKSGQRSAVYTAATFYGTPQTASCGEAMDTVYKKLKEYGFPQLPMRQAQVTMLTKKTARVGFKTAGKVVRGTKVAPTRQWVGLVKKNGVWKLNGASGTRTL